jgi:hypothetical protein
MGFVCVPLYACIVERGGHHAAFFGSTAMFCIAMALSAVRATLSPFVQIGTFVCLAMGRQFLFSSFFAVVLENFGTRAYGRLIGCAGLVAGSCQLGMNPLLRLVLGPAFQGNFTPVQLLQLGCVAAVGHFPWWLRKQVRARAASSLDRTAP